MKASASRAISALRWCISSTAIISPTVSPHICYSERITWSCHRLILEVKKPVSFFLSCQSSRIRGRIHDDMSVSVVDIPHVASKLWVSHCTMHDNPETHVHQDLITFFHTSTLENSINIWCAADLQHCVWTCPGSKSLQDSSRVESIHACISPSCSCQRGKVVMKRHYTYPITWPPPASTVCAILPMSPILPPPYTRLILRCTCK